MYVVLEWICKSWTKCSEAKLRHVSLNGFARLVRYLSFWVLWKSIVIVVEREWVKQAENQQTLITNRLQETLVLAQNTQNNEKNKIFWKASLLTLTNDLFYLTSTWHHPASLYREGSICEEDILRYSFRTDAQPRSHRLADLWLVASKSNTRLIFTVLVSNMQ